MGIIQSCCAERDIYDCKVLSNSSESFVCYVETTTTEPTKFVTKNFLYPIHKKNPHYLHILDFLKNTPNPHTINIYDYKIFDKRKLSFCASFPQLVVRMEYSPYDDVFNLKYDNVLTKNDILEIARLLIDAVRFLHQHGIIHGDIKLENVLLSENTIKLIDFEASTRVHIPIDYRIIRTKMKVTRDYASPELLEFGHNGFSNDIWALGMSLYMLFENEFCFNINEILQLKRVPKLNFTETPELFREIIKECLTFTLKNRINIEQIWEKINK